MGDKDVDPLYRTPYTIPSTAVSIFVPIFTGLIFGIAVEKGRTYRPELIVNQLIMKKMVLVKMILSAIVSSLLVVTLFSLFKTTSTKIFLARRWAIPSARGIYASVLGGALLGIGMSLSGAYPSAIYIQIGAGVWSGIYVLMGGLLACILYGEIENTVISFLELGSIRRGTFDVFAHIGIRKLAISLCGSLILCIMILETLHPTSWDLSAEVPFTLSLRSQTWPPYSSGAVIGLLQFPLIFFLHDTLGSAKATQTLANYLLLRIFPSSEGHLKLMERYDSGIEPYSQVIHILSATVGSFISSYTSATFYTNSSLPFGRSFVGGILLLLGSRISGGCIIGHGVSGIALLSIISFSSILSMIVVGLLFTNIYGCQI